jgi:hypothetical protein
VGRLRREFSTLLNRIYAPALLEVVDLRAAQHRALHALHADFARLRERALDHAQCARQLQQGKEVGAGPRWFFYVLFRSLGVE